MKVPYILKSVQRRKFLVPNFYAKKFSVAGPSEFDNKNVMDNAPFPDYYV